jgi:hypothetical protein
MTRAVGPAPAPVRVGATREHAPEGAALRRSAFQAALELETLLVRQLLESTHALGRTDGGYSAVALDALAAGVVRGGGVGIASKIEDMLDRSGAPPRRL